MLHAFALYASFRAPRMLRCYVMMSATLGAMRHEARPVLAAALYDARYQMIDAAMRQAPKSATNTPLR